MCPPAAARYWNISKEKYCLASQRSKASSDTSLHAYPRLSSCRLELAASSPHPQHDLTELLRILHPAQCDFPFSQVEYLVDHRSQSMFIDESHHCGKIFRASHRRSQDIQLLPEYPPHFQ